MRKALGTWDYVVVGGGTAGCLLANRLSSDPEVTVLLLEAGGKDDWIWIHIPVGYLYCIGNPRTDWCYRTEPEPGLNGRSILYARGRVLGGCSSINAMVYMRGQKRDYDEWARLTADSSWAWENVLPVFRKSEDHWRGASEFHGARGAGSGVAGHEWRVEQQRLSWKILDAFQAAAEECGIPRTDDFNRGDNDGSGKFEVNQRRGVRWSAAKAFLRPAMRRANLAVRTGCRVERLRLEGKRTAGVEFGQDGEPCYAEARIETILAAGAIGSPQILQLSGIGPAGLLQGHGIAVRHESPGVGENLQDHLQLRMAFRVKNALTVNQLFHSWHGKARMALEYALFRTGPLTMAPSQLGIFTRSSPGHATPNLEYHVQPVSLDRFGEPPHRFPAFTASVANLRPTSRGSVRIAGPDPRAAPAIRPNYLATPEDRGIAADSLRLTRRIVRAKALAPYEPDEFIPGRRYDSDEELAKAAGDIGTTIFHPVGTCRMGPASDPGAVVDTRLRVHGLAGLRVVDASIMPTITSGNTNSPTLMIAERGSAMIREDRKRA
ncbi:MAG: GMC family oxidoreductase N-terminal domain-containing protein [Burkholderiales bacterium]